MSRPALVAALVAIWVNAAGAHVPQLQGRLIDLVGESDLVVIGTVEAVQPVAARLNETTMRIDTRLSGETALTRLRFRGGPETAAGERFVFFLRRDPMGFECVQPTGTVFPSRPEDDDAYRNVITGVQRGLRAPEGDRETALRAALIPALAAAPMALRYHAVLELGGLAHHGLTDTQRRALAQVLENPSTDPAIRPIVASLLRPPGR